MITIPGAFRRCIATCILLLAGYLGLISVSAAADNPQGSPWSFDTLRRQAAEVARNAYRPYSEPVLPDALAKIGYDEYQSLQFRAESGPWHGEGLRFDLGLMHRGFIFREPVKVDLLESGQPRPFPFSPAQFNYDKIPLKAPLPAGLDFAGFKVLFHDEAQRKWHEVASFLGASYFRLIGTRQQYGASGRVLALDTGEAAGEEFPRLTHFWIQKPEKLADHLEVFGLLDSPSVSGACRFVLSAGEQTGAEVEVCLYLRNAGKKFGIAPLTSMFLVGENRTRFIPDFRPEVHDSDGLLVASADGNRFWRPLQNPEKRHRITRYPNVQVAGFGLMQRDRDFRNYQDLAAHFEMRPSLWVEFTAPRTDGTVELVEIPTPNEYNDNIVAYWVPNPPLEAGKEARFQYRISALSVEPESGLLRVAATRLNPAQEKRPPRFIIDFSGATLATTGADGTVSGRATATSGQIKNLVTQPNEVAGGWRVFFDLENPETEPSEIRLFLEVGGKRVSETWVYAYHSF